MTNRTYCAQCGSPMPTLAKFCMDCGARIAARPKRSPIPSRMRFEVLKRDNNTCAYCGRRAPAVVLHIDHVIPVSRGGTNVLSNLVTACEDCNRGKGNVPLIDTSLQEWEKARVEKERAARTLEIDRDLKEREKKKLYDYFRPLIEFSEAINAGWPCLPMPYCEILVVAQMRLEGKTVKEAKFVKALKQLDRIRESDRKLDRQQAIVRVLLSQLLSNLLSSQRPTAPVPEHRWAILLKSHESLNYEKWQSSRDNYRDELNWKVRDIKAEVKRIQYTNDENGPSLSLNEDGPTSRELQELMKAWKTYVLYREWI